MSTPKRHKRKKEQKNEKRKDRKRRKEKKAQSKASSKSKNQISQRRRRGPGRRGLDGRTSGRTRWGTKQMNVDKPDEGWPLGPADLQELFLWPVEVASCLTEEPSGFFDFGNICNEH